MFDARYLVPVQAHHTMHEYYVLLRLVYITYVSYEFDLNLIYHVLVALQSPRASFASLAISASCVI